VYCLGQEKYEISIENGTYKNPLVYDGNEIYISLSNKYSKPELIRFSENLDRLVGQANLSAWEGSYDWAYSETAYTRLYWTKELGYVDFQVYTCLPELRSINFGIISETDSPIDFIPQPDKNSIRKNTNPTKYIKVRWGDRQCLVEETSLLSFSEKAAGIYVERDVESVDYMSWSRYWERGDSDKPLIGLPLFPSKYKNLERKPIKSKIAEVRKRTIEVERTIGNAIYSEAAWYEVIIEGGSNIGIKEGMEFYCPKIENTISIVEVAATSSRGIIHFEIDENKQDKCFDDTGNIAKCSPIKKGFAIETVTGRINYWE
jgi:hypothetical protein